ncbi:MAG: hypothetical protein R2729_13160 [Bryobacteraceae bacterium]
MSLTATELRKNLFQILEKVSGGDEVEVLYKGAKLRISPALRTSRLSRLIERDIGEVGPDESGWDDAAKREWEAEVDEMYSD